MCLTFSLSVYFHELIPVTPKHQGNVKLEKLLSKYPRYSSW